MKSCMRLIPNVTNKFTFELRESYRQIDDRKVGSIKAIQPTLRSSIFGALTRSIVNLFVAFGITQVFYVESREESPTRTSRSTSKGF